MTLTVRKINVVKSARYYIMGTPSEKVNSVLIVLHGYGQLAREFIKYFKPVASQTSLIIAPEALNKFYLKGFSGSVGATWMTKEEREEEINNYADYLDSVFDEVIRDGLFGNANITLLGFSQGSTTACRWIIKGRSKFNRLILWGGGFPDDIDLAETNPLFAPIDLNIVAGDKDQFITEERLESEKKRLEESKLICSIHRFKGGHEIDAGILRMLL